VADCSGYQPKSWQSIRQYSFMNGDGGYCRTEIYVADCPGYQPRTSSCTARPRGRLRESKKKKRRIASLAGSKQVARDDQIRRVFVNSPPPLSIFSRRSIAGVDLYIRTKRPDPTRRMYPIDWFLLLLARLRIDWN
jgi:hypothetical protein